MATIYLKLSNPTTSYTDIDGGFTLKGNKVVAVEATTLTERTNAAINSGRLVVTNQTAYNAYITSQVNDNKAAYAKSLDYDGQTRSEIFFGDPIDKVVTGSGSMPSSPTIGMRILLTADVGVNPAGLIGTYQEGGWYYKPPAPYQMVIVKADTPTQYIFNGVYGTGVWAEVGSSTSSAEIMVSGTVTFSALNQIVTPTLPSGMELKMVSLFPISVSALTTLLNFAQGGYPAPAAIVDDSETTRFYIAASDAGGIEAGSIMGYIAVCQPLSEPE